MSVYIIGVGMTKFSKFPNRNVRDLAIEAIDLCLKDAGLSKSDIQATFFSNTFWGLFSSQHSIKGQVVLRSMGVGSIPVVNVENACAGASTALHLAVMGIRAGMFEVALVVGSEKISHKDKTLSLKAYAFCMDVGNFKKQMELFEDINKTLGFKDETPFGYNRSVFMDAYATGARWHMKKYGTTQKQLAIIASKNHFHGSLNPKAQYRKPMTVDEILNDKAVSYPLTRSMCAPVGDGAAAAIICSESYLKRLNNVRPVKVLASVLGSGAERDMEGEDIGKRMAKKAYDEAGVGPKDIDVAELHDATAYGELHQCEMMGFCTEGEGGVYGESGATKLGGKKPINTSGGLESRGHPIGASGLAQIHEIVTQLRGEAGERQVKNARIGLAENGGGNIGVEEAAMCIHILQKV